MLNSLESTCHCWAVFIYVVAGIIIGFVVSLALVDETGTSEAIAIGVAWPLALVALLVWAVATTLRWSINLVSLR